MIEFPNNKKCEYEIESEDIYEVEDDEEKY